MPSRKLLIRIVAIAGLLTIPAGWAPVAVADLGLYLASALLIAAFRPARDWLLPVLVVSQAVPVFALAPILVLWLGYGLASKVAMATLIIYFPVTAAFYDGLKRTEPGWLDLARTMGGSRLAVLRVIRIPAALPALASGLRVATAVAPMVPGWRAEDDRSPPFASGGSGRIATSCAPRR